MSVVRVAVGSLVGFVLGSAANLGSRLAPGGRGWHSLLLQAGLGRRGGRGQVPAAPSKGVLTGLEVLLAGGLRGLKGKKVGLVANPTTVLADLTHAVDALAASPDVDLVAVFGPEHGFRGAAQAGYSEGASRDKRTGIPVHDIYRKSGGALARILESSGIDVLLIDLQDIGTRFYTYIWTLYDCMVACAMASRPIRVVVLDRPNPIGGLAVEGPLLEAEFATFVGRKGIALRHGMTLGELARLFNSEYVPGDAGGARCDLDVVGMRGWRRGMMWDDTGLPWVPPSPNMPTAGTALVYPGTGFFEGTNVSEGRGSCLPFHLVGAPWVDAGELAAAAAAAGRDGACGGCSFREAHFVPTFSKFASQGVAGVQVHVHDPAVFCPVRAAVTLLVLLKRHYPGDFSWKSTGAHVLGGRYWVDSLSGSARLREAVDRGCSADEVLAEWQEDLTWFLAMRSKYLLY